METARRLTAEAEKYEVRVFADFADVRFAASATRADYAAGCRVVYRDDAGGSRWQIVDAAGRGDGTGRWFPIVEE